MNRTMTRREEILVCVFAALLLVLLYNLLVLQPVRTAVAAAQEGTLDLESQIQTETIRKTQLAQMRSRLKEVEQNGGGEVVSIPPYDNLQNLVTELNRILAGTVDYDLNFSPPATDEGGLTRRSIGMSFTCVNYAAARDILNELYTCRYRCQIGDFTMNSATPAKAGGTLSSGSVLVSLTVTFYEMNQSGGQAAG